MLIALHCILLPKISICSVRNNYIEYLQSAYKAIVSIFRAVLVLILMGEVCAVTTIMDLLSLDTMTMTTICMVPPP